MWAPLRRLPKRYLRWLPSRLAVPVLSATGWPRGHTEDVRVVTVPRPFRLEAYWLHVGGQQGPAYSLFYEDDEILRVDCLPEGGHIHYGLAEARHRNPAQARVFLPPGPLVRPGRAGHLRAGHQRPVLHRPRPSPVRALGGGRPGGLPAGRVGGR